MLHISSDFQYLSSKLGNFCGSVNHEIDNAAKLEMRGGGVFLIIFDLSIANSMAESEYPNILDTGEFRGKIGKIGRKVAKTGIFRKF